MTYKESNPTYSTVISWKSGGVDTERRTQQHGRICTSECPFPKGCQEPNQREKIHYSELREKLHDHSNWSNSSRIMRYLWDQ